MSMHMKMNKQKEKNPSVPLFAMNHIANQMMNSNRDL